VAGITADTPDPEGGKFYREDGRNSRARWRRRRWTSIRNGRHLARDRPAMCAASPVRRTSLKMAAAGLTSTTDA
jgi:hypothetical protein